MIQPENKNAVEIHGCIVCGRPFEILAVYAPNGKFLNCAVISPGFQIVPDQHQPLVACQTQINGKIEAVYQSSQSRMSKNLGNE